MITESSEDAEAPEPESLGSESGLMQQKQQKIDPTAMTRLDPTINDAQGPSLDSAAGVDGETDVTLSCAILVPDSAKGFKGAAENEGGGDDPHLRKAQGFDDEGILRVPTLEEALNLWDQWQSQSRERTIGDFVAEYLGMNDPQPTPAQVSQLEVWIRRLSTIHDIKDTITRLRSDFGTREGRIKGEIYRYPEVALEEREKIMDIGLDGTTGLKGNILLNEYTEDPSDSAPDLLFRWTSFKGLHAQKQVGEIHVEVRFGDLIPSIFAGQDWMEYR
jgi:hypothetical protein